MPQVTRKRRRGKPERPDKPYPDFPLFAHANGQWCKKIKGKQFFFGVWADPDAAHAKYEREKHDRYNGRTPQPITEGVTVADVLNHFRNAKDRLHESGELAARSLNDYTETCDRIVEALGGKESCNHRIAAGLGPEDFDKLRARIAKKWGPVALGNEVNRIRIVFKYAFEVGLLPTPMRFGPHFKRPSKKSLRKARNKKGPRMFEPAEIHAMLKVAPVTVRAMILLGINCGFGNTDVGTLPMKALDLRGGWVDYPRPKTEIPRRCPLWPETVAALKAAIAKRPLPKDPADADLVFLTKYGQRWAKETRDNPVSKEIAKLLVEVKLSRPGLNFYALRHTFETIGGESRDQAAVDAIMGHAPKSDDMSAVYRERMTDERLKAVSDHVRKWLMGKPKAAVARKRRKVA